MSEARSRTVILYYPTDFIEGPTNNSRFLLVDVDELLDPKRTGINSCESEWPLDPVNFLGSRLICVLEREWGQVKNIISDFEINFDAFEVSGRKLIPKPNGLSDTLGAEPCCILSWPTLPRTGR
jgi:hypothetical protein